MPGRADLSRTLQDTAVPGVATLTDLARLAVLAERAGRTLVSRGYLRWKPGTSAVAGLELDDGPAYALAVSAAAAGKLAKTVEQSPPDAVLLADPDTRLVLARPAADRDLPALRDLPDAVRDLIGEQPGRPQTLAYKPQRRWVGAVRSAGETGRAGEAYVVRAYRRSDLEHAHDALVRARRLFGPLVPEPLGRTRGLGLLVQSWSAGTGLDRVLGSRSSDPALAAVGRMLAEVHSHKARSAAPRKEGASPKATTTLLEALDPLLGAWAARLARRLTDSMPEQPRQVFVHGDFSTDQVVVAPSGALTFLDWDRAGTGAAAVDLASLRAAGLDAGRWQQVLQAYATVRRLPSHLDWYVASALFERAPEPFRRGCDDWSQQITRRLAQVEDLLR